MVMERHWTEEELISYLEAGSHDRTVGDHLANCAKCSQLASELAQLLQQMEASEHVQPPAAVRAGFEQALAAEQQKLAAKMMRLHPWQLAAAVALLVAGFWSGRQSVNDRSSEVLALESQVEVLKELATMNTLQRHTASERIQAVNRIEEGQPKASDQLVNTLITTLNTDESPNVRYAAAQALRRYTHQEQVRLALTESLRRQKDPLLQIALISTLVEAQERTAIKSIRELIEEEGTIPEVKQQAKVALAILS